MIKLVAGALVVLLASRGPTIVHEPAISIHVGEDLVLRARTLHKKDVQQLDVFWRLVGDTDYTRAGAERAVDPEDWSIMWKATVPGAEVTRDLEYYFRAYDVEMNGPSFSGSPDTPHHVAVSKLVPRAQASSLAVVQPPVKEPLAKQWWFWTLLVGVAAAVAIPVTLCATGTGICEPQYDDVRLRVRAIAPGVSF